MQDNLKRNYMVKLFKVLANANRLKILQAIAEHKDGSISVSALSEKVGLSQANLSNHLAKMRLYGVLRAKQVGLNVFYSVKDENALKVLKVAEK